MTKLNIWRTSPLLRLGLSITLGLTFLSGMILTISAIRPPDVVQAQVSTSSGTLVDVVQFTTEKGMTGTYAVPIPITGAYIGAYIGDLTASYTVSLDMIQSFEMTTGRRLAIINRFWGMTINGGQYADFDWLNLDEHFADGRLLMISWNPVDSTTFEPITYQGIISGQYDQVIISAAQSAAVFGKPLFMRWSWEMDGDWNPSGGPNAFGPDGTQPYTMYTKTADLNMYFGAPDKADGPERFVEAWKYIRRIFDKEGADNVIWVWSPNWISGPKVEDASWNNLAAYYPGDDQVDWIGTSIYYRDDGGNKRLSFSQMFSHGLPGPSIAKFHEMHPEKPVMIAEIGASEIISDANAKANWIKDTYGTEVKEYP